MTSFADHYEVATPRQRSKLADRIGLNSYGLRRVAENPQDCASWLQAQIAGRLGQPIHELFPGSRAVRTDRVIAASTCELTSQGVGGGAKSEAIGVSTPAWRKIPPEPTSRNRRR